MTTPLHFLGLDALQQWYPHLADNLHRANAAGDAAAIIHLVDRSDRPLVLGSMADNLDPAAFAALVSMTWSDAEYFDPERWGHIWDRVVAAGTERATMTADELAVFDGLPDHFTAYRGYCAENGNAEGRSWTLDPAVAERFSNYARGRVVTQPTVREATLDKANVICLLRGRNESELILREAA